MRPKRQPSRATPAWFEGIRHEESRDDPRVPDRIPVGVARFQRRAGVVHRVHPVPRPYRSGVVVCVPRHRRRCAHPAEQRDRHGGDRDRVGARPDRCCAATVLDAVFTTVATEFPAGSPDPGRAQHLRRDLRLFRGRPVHGGAIRRGAHRGLPTAGGHRGHRLVVCQPGHGGVFRGPPRTLHSDRHDRQTG